MDVDVLPVVEDSQVSLRRSIDTVKDFDCGCCCYNHLLSTSASVKGEERSSGQLFQSIRIWAKDSRDALGKEWILPGEGGMSALSTKVDFTVRFR